MALRLIYIIDCVGVVVVVVVDKIADSSKKENNTMKNKQKTVQSVAV